MNETIKHHNFAAGIPISTGAIFQKENEQPVKTIQKKRFLYVCMIAVLIAMATSLIARGLILLISLFTNIAFYGNVSFHEVSPADNNLGWWVLLVPVVGGVIVGLMAFYGSKAIRGHGIPEAMEQILTNKSRIAPVITYLKPLSSAISIGTGGPFGAEGPIIATGGALGSTIGQLLKISDYERKILLASGAAAGMSAIFDTPVAAVFLAVELLLFEFSPKSILPVALAAITGAAGHHLLFNAGYVFAAPAIEVPGSAALAIYSVMGLLLGLIAAGVTKAVYIIEDGFEKLPIHWMWWPAIGGLAVGLVGKIAPHTLGVGYENITGILSGSLPVKMVLVLCVLKFISWAVALGSGTSGGTLAPLLTIGGATGVLLGMLATYLFPTAGIVLPIAAMVGMSAMFAGASRALLTSIIFALESTGQLHALLPLLSACTASYLVSYFLMEHTIMTEKIARRGVNTPHAYEPDLLERTNIGRVMTTDGLTINGNNTLQEVRDWLGAHQHYIQGHFIVVDEDDAYMGIIKFYDLYGNKRNANDAVKLLIEEKYITLSAKGNLRAAIEMMERADTDVMAVTLDNDPKRIIGILSYKDIFSVYKMRINEHTGNRYISVKRQGIKILLKGQKLISRFGGKAA